MELLGVRIDPIRRKKLGHALLRLLDSKGQHMLATPNPEMLVHAHRNPGFRNVLNQTTLNIPDGVGLQFAGRVLGRHIGERVTGVDLMTLLARLAHIRGARMMLLGGEPGIAPAVAEIFSHALPTLDIHAVDGGWIAKLSDGSWVGEQNFLKIIQEHEPHILCVAFGHGKQEEWISEHLPKLPSVKIAVGVGGALDYYAGKTQRPPRLMQRIGLEWLWRLLREPRRFRRILDAVIIFPVLILRNH